jgi:hypothetical protein
MMFLPVRTPPQLESARILDHLEKVAKDYVVKSQRKKARWTKEQTMPDFILARRNRDSIFLSRR